MKWDVPDDHGTVQRLVHGIGAMDAGPVDAAAQPVHASRIDVDGAKVSPQSCEVPGEGAIAGTDLEDRPLGGCGQRCEVLESRAVDEEVLAEFMSATSMGSRSQDALQS